MVRARKKKESKRRPEIDRLLTGKYSYQQIAERVHPLQPNKQHGKGNGYLTKQRIEQYVDETGQHDEFLKKRERHLFPSKIKEHEREEYTYLLVHCSRRMIEEGLYQGDSVKLAKKMDRYGAKRILKLLQTHRLAEVSGVELSFRELTKKAGFDSYEQVQHIFDDLGIGHKKYVLTPAWKKSAIKRARSSNIPLCDIAYFLEVPEYIVKSEWKFFFGSTAHISQPLKKFDHNKSLYLHMASQMYLARDEYKWSDEDITTCFDNRKEMVDYAFAHRTEIESKTRSLIDLLYGTSG